MTTKTLTEAEIRNIDANLAMLDEAVRIALGDRWTYDKHVARKAMWLTNFDPQTPLTDEDRKLILELLTVNAYTERGYRPARATATAKARKTELEVM